MKEGLIGAATVLILSAAIIFTIDRYLRSQERKEVTAWKPGPSSSSP